MAVASDAPYWFWNLHLSFSVSILPTMLFFFEPEAPKNQHGIWMKRWNANLPANASLVGNLSQILCNTNTDISALYAGSHLKWKVGNPEFSDRKPLSR